MNRFLKAAVLSAAVGAVVLAPIADAAAGERGRYRGGVYVDRNFHPHRFQRHHRHRPVIVHRDNTGDLLAAGIIGLAVGAFIAGAATPPPEEGPYRPVRPRPYREYFPPEPGGISDEPQVIYAPQTAGAEPWSPEWLDYCRNRFRSFDDDSGTYLGFDGERHFCVAN